MLVYFTELKNRFFLIVLNWSCILFVSYLYKDYVLFFLLKVGLLKNEVLFDYFVFTDVIQVFSVYIKAINFFVNPVSFFYLCLQTLMFLGNGLYSFEKKILINFYILSFLNWIFSFFLFDNFILSFLLGSFLEFNYFNQGVGLTFYFESNILSYINFYSFYFFFFSIFTQIFSTIFFYLYFSSFKKIYIFFRFRKIIYLVVYIVFIGCLGGDFFAQFFLFCFLFLFGELFSFFYILKKKLIR